MYRCSCFPAVSSRSGTAVTLSFRGTARIFFDFEFVAGMGHTLLPRSTYSHRAGNASFSLAPVANRKSAIWQTVRFLLEWSTFNSRFNSSSFSYLGCQTAKPGKVAGQIKQLESRGGSMAEPAERTSGGEKADSQDRMISEHDNSVDKHLGCHSTPKLRARRLSFR